MSLSPKHSPCIKIALMPCRPINKSLLRFVDHLLLNLPSDFSALPARTLCIAIPFIMKGSMYLLGGGLHLHGTAGSSDAQRGASLHLDSRALGSNRLHGERHFSICVDDVFATPGSYTKQTKPGSR